MAEEEAADMARLHPQASLIAFRMDERVAVFALAQALRQDASETLHQLRKRGLKLHILSGEIAPRPLPS